MKKTDRMIAMALVAAVTTSVVPTTAFATEGTDNGSNDTSSSAPSTPGTAESGSSDSGDSGDSDNSDNSDNSGGSGEASGTPAPTVTVTVNAAPAGLPEKNISVDVKEEKTESPDQDTKTKEATGSSSSEDGDSTPAADNNTPGEPTGTPDAAFAGADGNPVSDETREYLGSFNEGTETAANTETNLEHNEYNQVDKDGSGRPTAEEGSAGGSASTTTTTTETVKFETPKQQTDEGETKLMDEADQPQGEDREHVEEGDFGDKENEYSNDMSAEDLPGGDIPYDAEQNLTASINAAAGEGATATDSENLVDDWENTYNKMVSDAMNNVKAAAENEAVADKKNNDAAVTMTEGTVEGHTNPENNADGDYKYRYTGETDTDTYEKIVTITKTTDANGNVTFERTTEVIVTPKNWTNEQTLSETELKPDEYTYTYGELEENKDNNGQPVVEYKVNLPAKPALGETKTDADGKTMTVVEVRDHYEEVNGVMTHVGYEKIFEIKDADGNVINDGEAFHIVNGEIIRTETNTKQVEKTTEISEFTQKQTVTEKEVEKRVSTSTVTMDMDDATRELVVKLLGASVDKDDHGNLEGMEAIAPDIDYYDDKGAVHDLVASESFIGPKYATSSETFSWDGAVSIENSLIDNLKADEGEFILTGWGMYSQLGVRRADEDGSFNRWAHQYVLQDENGNDFYAYCVEMGQGVDMRSDYVMENLDEVDYFEGGEEAKENIRKVVMNGFWGSTGNQTDADGNTVTDENGDPVPETGSLDAVKAMLKENGWTDTELSTLTAGQALTATQAAIWYYGNDGGESLPNLEHLVYSRFGDGAVGKNETDNKNVVKMFNTLLGLSNVTTEEKESNLIDLEDVTATITAKEKIDEGADVNNPDDDTYNTDVSFTLAVVPTGKDTLMVVVQGSDGTNLVDPIDLNSFAEGTMDANNKNTQYVKTKDANGHYTYTLGNIQLAEGVSINLNIDGAQYLKQGAYVYRSEGFDTSDVSKPHSQTMIGIAEGYRSVSMDMSLTFSVDDPMDVGVSGKESGYEQARKDKKYRTDNYVTEITEVSALMEVTTTTTTVASQEWGGEYSDEWSYKDGNDTPPGGGGDTPPGGNTPPSDDSIIIDDGDVPLAEDPGMVLGAEEEPEPMVLGAEEEPMLIAATGDSNHMAAGFGGMFAALAGMFFLRKKKEQ